MSTIYTIIIYKNKYNNYNFIEVNPLEYNSTPLYLYWEQYGYNYNTDEKTKIYQVIIKVYKQNEEYLISYPSDKVYKCEYNNNIDNIETKILNFRSLFLPQNSDSYIVSFDYSQIEFRMLAHFSEDESLLHIFNTSPDIFTDIMKLWKTLSPHLKILTRDIVKKVCYSVIYGVSSPGLAKEINIDMKIANQILDTFWSSFPTIAKWKMKITEEVKENGYITTLSGRKRYFINENQHETVQFQRQAIHTLCQASAADLIKQVMINVSNLLLIYNDVHLLCQIHDELLFEIPKSKLEKISIVIL